MIFQISPKLSVAILPQTYRQTVPQTRPCSPVSCRHRLFLQSGSATPTTSASERCQFSQQALSAPWVPAGFFPGVGKLGGLETKVPQRSPGVEPRRGLGADEKL